MAKLVSYIISQKSGTTSDGAQFLYNPNLVINIKEFPSKVRFSLSVGVTGVSLKKDNEISLIIKNPNQKIVLSGNKATIQAIEHESKLPLDYQGFFGTADIVLSCDIPGCYVAEVFVNDEKVGTAEIPIFPK